MANSSNSRRAVEVASRLGTPGHLIDGVADLRAAWLAEVCVVGITAGASAPYSIVDSVIDALDALGPVTVVECETIHFGP